MKFPSATMLLGMLALFAASAGAQENTWEAPPARTQIEMDDTIVPVGKGAIFVPSMTDPDNEPNWGVLDNGDIADDAPPGTRIVVAPGMYTIVYGSGTNEQMMRKTVRVQEAATTLVKPDWSGLVIEVINESRANIREYYELFDMEEGISYGIGQGVEEGLDERLRTWILPPGIYKIVKPGENLNAVINFGTIRLLPGELVHAQLVIDSEDGNFLGFGRISDVRQVARRDRLWRARSELSGNALLNYIPSSQSGAETDANFTATVQLLTDGRIETDNHIVPVWFNIEEGLSMQSDRDLHKYTDKAELRLTYIYRLSDLVSPYVRAAAETRLFDSYHRFEDPTDFVEVDAAGDTVRTVRNAGEVKLGEPFHPVHLKQGFGINSFLVKSVPVNLNLRSGWGARQTYADDTYLFNSESNILSPIVETDITGLEMLFLGDIRLGRYVLFNTEFDILMPNRESDSWVFDGENRLRLNITSNVSLLFTYEFWRDESVDSTQQRYQTLLRFSKFL